MPHFSYIACPPRPPPSFPGPRPTVETKKRRLSLHKHIHIDINHWQVTAKDKPHATRTAPHKTQHETRRNTPTKRHTSTKGKGRTERRYIKKSQKPARSEGRTTRTGAVSHLTGNREQYTLQTYTRIPAKKRKHAPRNLQAHTLTHTGAHRPLVGLCPVQ